MQIINAAQENIDIDRNISEMKSIQVLALNGEQRSGPSGDE